MISLENYLITEVSGELLQKAMDKANELAKNGDDQKLRDLKAAQAKRFEKEIKRIAEEEKKLEAKRRAKEKRIEKDKRLKELLETLKPNNSDELRVLMKALCRKRGKDADLNDIDISNITELSYLFDDPYLKDCNPDISEWDTSNVTKMRCTFSGVFEKWYKSYGKSKFNGDISKWDVSNVENMNHIFMESSFNGNISNWNVEKALRKAKSQSELYRIFFYFVPTQLGPKTIEEYIKKEYPDIKLPKIFLSSLKDNENYED